MRKVRDGEEKNEKKKNEKKMKQAGAELGQAQNC